VQKQQHRAARQEVVVVKKAMELRSMTPSDWPAVASIYKEGILTGIATFETTVPSYNEWNKAHLGSCRIVSLLNHSICGWAALSPSSGRCVYGGVAEVSIYVRSNTRGKGIGYQLLKKLIELSEQEGLWTLQSGIFPENDASIALHQKLGFRLMGRREKIAKYNGQWKDNLVFERRSTMVGIN